MTRQAETGMVQASGEVGGRKGKGQKCKEKEEGVRWAGVRADRAHGEKRGD